MTGAFARQSAVLASAGLALALVSGCETLDSASAPDTPAEDTVTTLSAAPPDPVPAPPRAPVASRPAALPSKAVALNTPGPLVKPPVTSLKEDQIVGAPPATLLSLLGEPDTKTTSAPSQTWFYASGPCRLSIQLFKDLDSGGFRALKYSIEGGSTQRCLAQFEHLGPAYREKLQNPDGMPADEPSAG